MQEVLHRLDGKLQSLPVPSRSIEWRSHRKITKIGIHNSQSGALLWLTGGSLSF